jgi:hypothetical protein
LPGIYHRHVLLPYLFSVLHIIFYRKTIGNVMHSKDVVGRGDTLQSQYPKPIEVFIYAGDPRYAKTLAEAGLDTEGYVTIRKTKKLGDRYGWVAFTNKALPYFLPTDEADKKNLMQKVMTGEESFAQILAINEDQHHETAEATYTTKITGVTPFGKLIRLKDGATKQKKAVFIKNNGEWQLKERK